MAQETYYFSGKCEWAKVQEPDKKYNHYCIDVILDEESWDVYNRSGLKLKIRENEKGEKSVRFRRDVEKVFNGETVSLGKLKVINANEEKLEALVGNGSAVTVKVSTYDTKTMGKGHRLEAVRVNELVTYNRVDPQEVPFYE